EVPDWVEHYKKAWQRLDARTNVGRVTDLRTLEARARARHPTASGDRGVQLLRGNISALDFLHTLLAEPELLRRLDAAKITVSIREVAPALLPVLDKVLPPGCDALHFDYSAGRTAALKELLDRAPAGRVKNSLMLTLADDNVGVLPQLATSCVHTALGELR